MGVARTLKRLIQRRRPPAADAHETARVGALRSAVASLPSLDNEKPVSPAAADWLGNRRRLRELLAHEDPRRFLEWDVIHKTMFVGNGTYIPAELAELKSSSTWRARWKPALREDSAGCPARCRFRLSSSGNLIHHAYHFLRAEGLLGRPINSFNRLVEFGGGYGSSCRLAWRLGFRGRYVIFDLPEFSALQRYFLDAVGVPTAGPSGAGASCTSDYSQFQAEASAGEGLFAAFWSISETPLDFRNRVLASIEGLSDIVIAYQPKFAEMDNTTFFEQWSANHPRFKWRQGPIQHLPGNMYLVGSTRSI